MLPSPLAALIPNPSLATTLVQACLTAAQLDDAAMTKGEAHGYYKMLWSTLKREDFTRLLWSVGEIQRGMERGSPELQLNGEMENEAAINKWLNHTYLDLFSTLLHNFDCDGSTVLKRFSSLIESAAVQGDVEFFLSLAERLRERASRNKSDKRLGIAAFIRSLMLPCMLPHDNGDTEQLRTKVRHAAKLLNRPESPEGDTKTAVERDRALSKAIARELAALRKTWDDAPEWTLQAVDWPRRLQVFGILGPVREVQTVGGQ